jgi:uncharacterized protein (DUF927 family)
MSLTLVEYAAAKGLSVPFLESLGLHDGNGRNGHPHLVIPYRSADGALFRDRLRLALKVPEGSKDKRFIWAKAINPENKTCLYGLDRLDEARKAKYVVLVEGESDCHTLWSCGVPAIGVPGAKAWNDERDAPCLDGILTIFVVVEPGQSGQGMLKWLGDSMIRNRARLVWFDEPKDPSGLFLADPAAFAARFDERLQNADPPQADPDDDRKVTVSMSDDGFWLKDDKGELLRISQSFEVLGRCRSQRDANGRASEWGLFIRFKDWDGVMIGEVIGADKLSGDLNALCSSLSAIGFDVSRNERCRKMFATHLLGFSTADRVTLVQRAGWHTVDGQSVFALPDETISAQPLSEKIIMTGLGDRRQDAFGASGTLDQWKDGVGRLARGHLLARLSVSVALAGPLLRLAGYEGGGVHIHGYSSTGKTTIVKMGASVWRIGAELPTWRATANGLESAFARASDGFMPLDEIGQAEGREIANIIYMQANASGKIRMRRDTTERARLTWLTLMLSSGELPIEVKLAEEKARARAGHLVRLIDIKADRPNGAFDAVPPAVGVLKFVAECGQSSATYYGTAGPEFVHRLLIKGVTRDDIVARVNAFVKKEMVSAKSDAGQTARAAQRFGLIAAAGELATEFGVLPWSKGEATEAAAWAFKQWVAARGKAISYEDRQAIDQVRGMIERYGDSRFDDLDPPKTNAFTGQTPERRPVHDRLGFRRGSGDARRWLVLPEMFHKVMCAGLDSDRVAATLADEGMLERGG